MGSGGEQEEGLEPKNTGLTNEKAKRLFMKCEEVADHLRVTVHSAKTLESEEASILDGFGIGIGIISVVVP